MALFRVSNERAQFDAAGNDARDQYGAGIRFTQSGNARVTTGSATNYNQGIPMSATGQVAIVDATAGLPAGTIFHNGLPISGDKVCVSRNATAVVSNGTPYDSAGAVAADINLDLNFIGTDTLNSSVTFTRASSATFVGSNGLIQSATTNTPRFDYDPVTLAAKGLLIEEQRTNLVTYSEQLNNAYWQTASGTVTVTANAVTAPDGTLTADLVIPSAASAFHRIFSPDLNQTAVAYSVFVKAGGYSKIALREGATQGSYISVNLNTGTIIEATNVGTGTVSGATITAFGNGWYRLSGYFVTPINTAWMLVVLPDSYTSGNVTNAWTGDGVSGVYVWGAQAEVGAFATSYIPTVASQVTRSADVASVNTLSPWYNATEGTFFIDVASDAPASAANLMGFAAKQSSGTALAFLYDGGVYRSNAGGSISLGFTQGVSSKYALAYTNGVSRAGSRNGGAVATSTGISDMSLVTSVSMSDAFGLTGAVTRIRRFAYYPRRLSNAELQAITA